MPGAINPNNAAAPVGVSSPVTGAMNASGISDNFAGIYNYKSCIFTLNPRKTTILSIKKDLHFYRSYEATAGFEPASQGFADPRLTTWLCRHISYRYKKVEFRGIHPNDPNEIRTRVTAVKGRCLNRLTMGPLKPETQGSPCLCYIAVRPLISRTSLCKLPE